MKCPKNYSPGCSCSSQALEPNEDCYIHGYPDPLVCPYCGQFRKRDGACKRCGCEYGRLQTQIESFEESVYHCRHPKEKMKNGMYPHLAVCSGDYRFPAGTKGHCCCCTTEGFEKMAKWLEQEIIHWKEQEEKNHALGNN